MRLTLHPRLSRIVRALPQGGPLASVEIALLAVVAVQLARLFWAIVTPVSPLGDWRPPQVAMLSPAAQEALLARFDPFFRGQPGAAAPAAVTALSLKLFGIRLNEASGTGSAIVAGPDGVQNSVAVGQEIMSGVRLKAVALDHVVIDRGGVAETLYLDQSVPAPGAAATAAPAVAAPAAFNAPPPAPAQAVRDQFSFAPRLVDGRVAGLTIGPRGDAQAFRQSGLRDGDVVTRVDGRAVSSIADIQALESRLAPGASLSVAVERGGQVVPLTIALPNR